MIRKINLKLNVLLLLSAMCSYDSYAAQKASASVSAEIVSPAQVSAELAPGLQFSINAGILTMSLPAGGATASTPTSIELIATGTITASGGIVFSVNDPVRLSQLVAQLAASGGSLTTSGLMNGQGVQITVVQASEGGEGVGTVIAIVNYN